MRCINCNKKLSSSAKFCDGCGKAIVENKKPKTKVDKLKKNIINTGNSIYAIGWITIILNLGIWFWSILDKNFYETGLPQIDLVGVYIMVVASTIFIILGKRIKKLEDKNIKNYLKINLLICLLLFVWIVITGGRIGLLFFLITIYLISSLVSIKKLLKNEEFSSKLKTPKYILDKKGWIIFILSTIVLFFVIIKINTLIYYNNTPNGNTYYTEDVNQTLTKADYINEAVMEVKKEMAFPIEMDSVTIMSDMMAMPNAIRYVYILHDFDTSELTNQSFRDLILPDLCKSEDMLALMKQDINVEYLYTVKNTKQTFLISFNIKDCL